jgi:hypothetical protein
MHRASLHFSRQRGLSEANLAARVGLDELPIIKLDCRRIPAPRPMQMFERLGEVLGVPPAYVISAATGPPTAASRGNLIGRPAQES